MFNINLYLYINYIILMIKKKKLNKNTTYQSNLIRIKDSISNHIKLT